MEISIKSKNIEVSDHAKEYIEKKLLSIVRFLPHTMEGEEEDREEVGERADRIILEVEVEEARGVFRSEVHLSLPGKTIRVEDTADTLKESIDKARHELEREVKEYKEKKRDMARKGGQEAKEKRNI